MTAPHVRLHIGAMKTGTTYVQKMLGTNREQLAASGVLYPHPWSEQVVAVRDVLDLKGGSHLGSADGAWQTLVSKLKEWHGTEAVLSVEFLSFADPSQVRQIVDDLAPCNVSAVIGARDLGRVLPAQWQTAVRNGRTTTYREYLDGATKNRASSSKRHFWKRQDLGQIAARWAKDIGRENVTIVTVPPKGADTGELWRRMATAFNIVGDHLEHPTPSNESLGLTGTELLRRINLQAEAAEMSQWSYQHGVNRALSHAVLPDVPDPLPPLTVPRNYHHWVDEQAKRITKEITEAGVNVVGNLSDLTPRLTSSRSEVWPEELSDKDLLSVAVGALTKFSQNVADQKLKDLKRKKGRRGGADSSRLPESDEGVDS